MTFRSKRTYSKTPKPRWQLSPEPSACERPLTFYNLISTLNKPCHTSTAHSSSSSSSSPPIQEISNVCNDCDNGGHVNSAEYSSGSPGRTSKLERSASRWDRGSQSHLVPHVLASGVVWASDHTCTRAAFPAASSRCASVMPDVTAHRAACGVSYGMRTWTSREACARVSKNGGYAR